jgi:hypothetical protein
LIDDSNFAFCSVDNNEIFIFSLKNISKSNQSNLYIDTICQLKFHELDAYMFDYQISSDRILALTLFQDDEFLKYEIDLKKGNITSEIELNTPIKNTVISDASSKNIEDDKERSNDSINKNSHKKIEIKISSSNPKCVSSPENQEREGDKIMLNDFKKSISEKIITGIEEKLDEIINSKLNNFADNLNNRLTNVFSFMKKQTDELEEIRKKNSDNMLHLTNLILKNQTNNNNNNTIPNVNNLGNFNNANNHIYNKNLNMMNFINNQQQLQIKPNPLLMQMNMNMAMGGVVRPNWGYPFHLYPSEYIANSVNNLKILNNLNNNKNLANTNIFQHNPNPISQFNQGNYLAQKINLNQEKNNNNIILSGGMSDLTNDNKYKEDEIILENLEKKLSEIKNEEINNQNDGNLTLDLNNEKDKNAVNYSSDSKLILF